VWTLEEGLDLGEEGFDLNNLTDNDSTVTTSQYENDDDGYSADNETED
jgi:hypothetical protein